MPRTYNLPTGISMWNTDCNRCDDCGRWATQGDTIKHSSRCDTPTLQGEWVSPTPAGNSKSVVKAARDGDAYAQSYDDDDLLLAVRCGALSVSDAMNQDF